MTGTDARPVTLGPCDEPQHSGAIVAVNYGDYRCVEAWIRSGSNIGNWYCLGGEYGQPKVWTDPRTEMEKLMWTGPNPRPGPGEVPLHPHWEDVLARGPVTLLVAGDGDAYRAGWRNGRRHLAQQVETLSDEDPGD
jgi:hypothetical protein